jgi:DMSO/TMAO reductase YedYZ molybdopterin-dependent catalytic subunit
MDRRTFNKMLAFVGSQASVNQFLGMPDWLPAAWASEASPAPPLLPFPQKTDLILLTDRPPQLETPLKYFESNFTPNDAFFVRWHLSGIPTSIDTRTFRVTLAGSVKKPLTLSLHDLQTKFPLVTVAALCQCAGNGRSLFEPRVPGGQWGFGAMSNALWKGVRLSSLLDAAGVLPGSIQVAFRGLDEPPTPRVPRFEKSLPIDHAANGDVLLAYEMNGAPLPMLNGFPVRLVVPGWYATYWVKALSEITVLSQPLESFWMDTAYRIPNNSDAGETPQGLSPTTVPISQMPVHSIFVRPVSGERLRSGQGCTLRGVANDGGSGIKRVEVSTDGGETWIEVRLGRDLGRFSWRTWSWDWTPPMAGNYRLSVRAVSNDGQQQPASQWNRSGYQRDVIEQVEVTAA